MNIKSKIKTFGKGTWISLSILIILIIALRIAAPFLIKNYANKVLCEDIKGYCGSIEDVDLNLYRGAYVIEGVILDEVENNIKTPFVTISKIDISVEWKALLKGAIVGEIEFLEPTINFVKKPGEEEIQAGQDVDWRKTVKDLVPLKINRLAIINGNLKYLEPDAEPVIDLGINQLNLEVTNLNNANNTDGSLVSDFKLTALALNAAPVEATGGIDPFNENGSFDFDFKLENLDITYFNDYLKKYIKVDAETGTFNLFAEVKAKNGDFTGYIKPVINDLKILDIGNENNKNFFVGVWEGIVGLTVRIFENNKKDQVATDIPIEGSLSNPDFQLWPSIRYLFRNAFIQALRPKVGHIVHYNEDINIRKAIKKNNKLINKNN